MIEIIIIIIIIIITLLEMVIETGMFLHSFYTSDLMRKDVAETLVLQDGASLRTD
jgi:hypothetical protein